MPWYWKTEKANSQKVGDGVTRDDVRTMLKRCNSRPAKLLAFSYISFSEKEQLVMQLRYLHGLTQDETVERFPYCYAQMLSIPIEQAIDRYQPCLDSIKSWEREALNKCASVWPDTGFIDRLQKTIEYAFK